MTEEMASLFQPDSLLPVQYFENFRRKVQTEPEKRLLLAVLEDAVRRLREETAVEPCASLGLVREPELERLKGAGLMHYHHNLETARSFFGNVCTTHTYDEQLETIRAAKRQGMKLCSGGILGMGETPEQRVELAETLRDLGIDCVPMNFLNPRPGTPMAGVKAITPEECLAAIAVFRLMMPAANIFVMGGREVNLGAQQDLIFYAGANGTMVGNYLTSAGRAPDQVLGMVEDQGLRLRGPEDGRPWAFRGQAPSEANWNQPANPLSFSAARKKSGVLAPRAMVPVFARILPSGSGVIVTWQRQIDAGGQRISVIGDGGLVRVSLSNGGSILHASRVWREIQAPSANVAIKTFEQARDEAIKKLRDPGAYKLDQWRWGYKELAGGARQELDRMEKSGKQLHPPASEASAGLRSKPEAKRAVHGHCERQANGAHRYRSTHDRRPPKFRDARQNRERGSNHVPLGHEQERSEQVGRPVI